MTTLKDFHSKVKDLWIELPNYSFNHGPSDITKKSKHFVGRKKIIQRLKSIITSNASKSGAYLITGYRGMGKSSFVNEALYDISIANRKSKRWMNITILFLLTLFSVFITYTIEKNTFETNIILMILQWEYTYILLWTLAGYLSRLYLSKSIDSNYLYKNKNGTISHLRLILNPVESKTNNRFSTVSQFIFKLSVINVISIYIINVLKNQYLFHICFTTYFYTYILTEAGVYFLLKPDEWFKSIHKKILKRITNYFNYSNLVIIKINLGYDELKEIDILRLIARNIYTKYQTFRRSIYRNYLFWLFKVGLISSIIYTVSNQRQIENMTHSIKTDLLFYKYFPTQYHDLIDKSERNFYYPLIIAEQLIQNNRYTIDSYSLTLKILNTKFDSIRKTKSSRHISWNEYHPLITNRTEDITTELPIAEVHKDSLIQFAAKKYGIQLTLLTKLEEVIITTDFIIGVCWHKIAYSINYLVPFGNLIPQHISYGFIILFILTWILLSIITSRLGSIGTISQRSILQRLELLNDIIDSQTTIEAGGTASVSLGKSVLSKFKNKRKAFPKADDREIEKWLLEILDDINSLPRFAMAPQFILIFDELDKIEPNNATPDKKEKSGILFTTDAPRKRQQAIYKLLSNLKYFITTAKIKFIFIAGREMYDAYLADVSDRNFFNRSIFDDVIYVKSFLTDTTKNGNKTEEVVDITGLTEQYVCQHLIPEDFISDREACSLKTYYKYLTTEIPGFKDPTSTNLNAHSSPSKIPQIVLVQKREKVIYFLHQFIIYLMHHSNGAPKKIQSLFEKYVVKSNKDNQDENILWVGKNRESYYLSFNHIRQYKIGMISSIINPIIYSLAKQTNRYEDKLMVSSTFIIDHLFKFHKYGFSWQNIEHTPELIEIHKTPELRSFISSLMQYISQIHVDEIVSGLYTYKFPKKTSMELKYLSKISEEAAATYNFTLDESLAVKHHYEEQITILEKRYELYYQSTEKNDYIYSLSTLHNVLGDLYFYEDDLENAITHYNDSIQFLRQSPTDDLKANQIIFRITTLLKLGLAHEKRKAYDIAFTIYSEACSTVLDYRTIKPGDFGLEYVQNTKDNIYGFIIGEDSDNNPNKDLFHKHFQPKKTDTELLLSKKDFIKNFHKGLTPKKHEITYKMTAYEGVRLFYQPLLAKFQIIEKNNLGGISQIDLDRIIEEFMYLSKTLNVKEKYLVETEFYNKVGDILYYKNSITQKTAKKTKKDHTKPRPPHPKCSMYKLCVNGSNNKTWEIRYPCESCTQYMMSLQKIIKHYFKSNDDLFNQCLKILNKSQKDYKILYNNKLVFESPEDIKEFGPIDIRSQDQYNLYIILSALNNKYYLTSRTNSFKTMASLLSDIGDVRLSCSDKTTEISKSLSSNLRDLISYFDDSVKDEDQDSGEDKSQGRPRTNLINKTLLKILVVNNEFSKLDACILYYYAAYNFYKRAGQFKDSSYQLNKIMQVFREYLRNGNSDKKNEIDEQIRTMLFDEIQDRKSLMNVLVKKCIKGYYIAYKNIHLYQINKFKSIFEEKHEEITSQHAISLKKLPIDTELEEIIYVSKNLELRLNENSLDMIKTLFKYNLSSPYLNDNNMLNRTIRLQFKVRLNFEIFKLFDLYDYDAKSKHFKLENFEQIFKDSVPEKVKEFVSWLNSEGLSPVIKKKDKIGSKELFEFILLDSIYCLTEIVSSYKVYGQLYVLTHSYIAATHKKLFRWLLVYNMYHMLNHYNADLSEADQIIQANKFAKLHKQFGKNEETTKEIFNNIGKRIAKVNPDPTDLSSEIKKLINSNELHNLTLSYQAEKATQEYYSALETHKEGKTYKNLLENMFYLNDDFNDKLFHFRLAQERYRINIVKIRKQMKEVKRFGDDSKLYQIDSYLITQNQN